MRLSPFLSLISYETARVVGSISDFVTDSFNRLACGGSLISGGSIEGADSRDDETLAGALARWNYYQSILPDNDRFEFTVETLNNSLQRV